MDKFIVAKDATYNYKNGFSLDTINLEIYKEDITFIVGDNGCGKSTLSKLLSGINKPSGGNVWLDNLNTKGLSLSDIGKKIGYLWQNVDVQLFCIKAWDELIFKNKIEYNLTTKTINRAEELLKTLKIDHIKNSNIDSISKGEKQRLAIATMLLNDNTFFILDEPTVGLDEDCKHILGEIINTMNSNGVGFLIISHDEEFIKGLYSRVIHMKKGGIENDKRLYC